MTIQDRDQYAPSYPAYRNSGRIKYAENMFNAPDLRPSGSGPGYSVFNSAYGRHLAGVDDADGRGMETYPNELDILAVEDDVDGNGVFDPNLSHGNVHKDGGVFNDHQSLPGYVARDHFYSPSEVEDLTTGKPVNYVPGGAVAFQQGQEETFLENQAIYKIPPDMSEIDYTDIDFNSDWIPSGTSEMARPITSMGSDAPEVPSTVNWTHVGAALALGAVAGVALSYMVKK